MNHARLSLLVGLLLVACCVFVQVLPRDALLQQQLAGQFRRVSRIGQEHLFAQLRANDPPYGSVLPLPRARSERTLVSSDDRVRRRGLRTLATLVAMIDSCSICAVPFLKLSEDLKRKTPGLDVVVVSPSTAQELQRFQETNDLKLLVFISDPEGRLARKYNAAWRPRAYLLSHSGALLWC